MTRFAIVAALLFSLIVLAAPAATVAGPNVGDPAPALSTKDVKGRTVIVPVPGKAMLLAFVSRATGDRAATLNRDIRITHPNLEVITFVDLSTYPGFLHGMVAGKMKSRHSQALKEDAAAFEEAGKSVPGDLDLRIHLVPDFDGKIVRKLYGAKDTHKQAHFVVVAPDGTIAASFSRTPSLAEVSEAIDRLPAK